MSDFNPDPYHKVSIEMGRALFEIFEPPVTMDFGCGVGSILLGMRRAGADPSHLLGYDLDEEVRNRADEEIRGKIRIQDVTTMHNKAPTNNITICLEVAGHIELEKSDKLVKVLCQSTCSSGCIIFSSPSSAHSSRSSKYGNNLNLINTQPISNWLMGFYQWDFLPDIDNYNKLLEAWTEVKAPACYLKNMRVLSRGTRFGRECDAKDIASSIVKR